MRAIGMPIPRVTATRPMSSPPIVLLLFLLSGACVPPDQGLHVQTLKHVGTAVTPSYEGGGGKVPGRMGRLPTPTGQGVATHEPAARLPDRNRGRQKAGPTKAGSCKGNQE